MASRAPASRKTVTKRTRTASVPAAKKAKTTKAPAPKPAAAKKPAKPPKVKLVRDSFTIPKSEYEAIDSLKKRAGRGGVTVKKSELLRAGLIVLAALSDGAFHAAVGAVPRLKTGRPKKD